MFLLNKSWASLKCSLAILIVCAIASALLVTSAAQDSPTQDEPVHLTAGYSYWKTGDFRLSPEHPPFWKLVTTLPLFLLQPEFQPTPEEWQGAKLWAISKSFMYSNTVSADLMMLFGRIPVMLASLCLSGSLAWWVSRKAGCVAGIAAMVMFAFEPTVLAHSRYVTTDIPVTLFIWLSCISWYLYLEHGGRSRLLGTGLLVGLAFATKFSALFLPLALGLMWSRSSRRFGWSLAIVVGIAVVVAFSTYGFTAVSVAEDPTAPVQLDSRLLSNPIVEKAVHVRVPGYYFLRGIQMLMRDQIGGYHSYFMGQISPSSTWSYFPVAFLLKSCIAWLALILLAIVLSISQERQSSVRLLAIPVVVYLAFTLVSSFNIGIRHLLPIYPFLCAVPAIVVFGEKQKFSIRTLGLVLLGFFVIESGTAYPNYLSFFNMAAGGAENGHRYLLDSNLDWGQDLKRLGAYLESNQVEDLCLSYFGAADPAFYGINYEALPQLKKVEDFDGLNCVAAVSLQNLYATEGLPFEALQERKPTARVGTSILIYDLRPMVLKQ